jgi:hypothetical protein
MMPVSPRWKKNNPQVIKLVHPCVCGGGFFGSSRKVGEANKGLGEAPTVPRPTNPKEAANKGAGSEASLPVTLRSRRSAPELLFPPRFREEPIKTAAEERKFPRRRKMGL